VKPYWHVDGAGARGGAHRRAAAVDGKVAVGSQGVGAVLASVSSSGGVGSCGDPDISSVGGAPRCGSPAASPAKSVQGKDPYVLGEVRGHVFGGKRGRARLGEGSHLLGAS
jgi:hypothetical protein